MADRKYYVFCDDNCRFEGMNKEQILTAISEAVTSGEIKDIDSGFVTTLKEQNSGKGLQMWVGTQAEYNALQEIVDNCFYIISDDTTEEDIQYTLDEMKREVERVTETSDVSHCIVISEVMLAKELQIEKALYIQGNTVQINIDIVGGMFDTDSEEIDVCTINNYLPLCPISVTCSGYGAMYTNTPSHANAKLTPNGDSTATLRVTGKNRPSGGMCLTAIWLI